MVFYQCYWDVVGGSLTGLVNFTLATVRVPFGLLEFFVALILEKDYLESTSDIRPITLLNVAFKVVMKVLLNGMRHIMTKLIGPFHNSFLPWRSTLDNVILAQEVMHNMNRKKGKKSFMMIKVDLHKAYNNLD